MATNHFMTSHFSNSSGNYAGGYDDQTSMASSSSNPPLAQNYEVFLSFSGDDTRYGFTDRLYHGLVNRGIRVFRDSENLLVGQKIDELMEAITASKILLPIISTHYASSKWCLKELVQILKCSKPPHQFVLPIFYKVKPSDVREQKGPFGEEFQRFKEKYSNDIEHIELVQESEQAFEKIVSLKGWESNKFADGYEEPLVKAVVRRIFNELRKPILHVPGFLVGVNDHVKLIMEMIHAEQSNDAKIIAIHGMGGIGKTTLAKVLYNELFDGFDSRSFIPNIREASSTNKGIMDLQKQVISGVLADKSPQDILHVDEGISIIENIFKEKRLLLLLDDVSDEDQLNKLAVKNNWFGLETIVIITTRNKDITKATAVNLSYELNELDEDQSYELFCKHAFRGDASCLSNLEKIARGIVSVAGGLPLAIEIIGSLLYQRSEEFWSATLDKLRWIPDGKVLDRLMLSYDALEYEQQQIFLDIACLYIEDMPKYKYAFYMWDACGFHPKVGIEKLASLSLIKESDEGIIIHDQLRHLGEEIVRREGRGNIGMCSRFWLSKEADEMIKRKKGTPNIQALYLGMVNDLTSQHFEGIENLRLLHMSGGVHLAGDFEDPFSSIIWLRWGSYSNCIIDIMGINFNPRKLVILEIENTNITEHWMGWNQVKNLKVLILEYCNDLTTTPDFSASAVGGLVELVLRHCSNLKEIHPSIGKFRKTLKVLNVEGCRELEELPKEVGEMEELRELNMDDTGIGGFPICEGRMTKLHTLFLGDRKRLEYIPHTVGSLVELLELDLSYCKWVINIPEAIGKLRSLIHLDLGFTRVTQLPDSIGDLYNLERLLINNTPIKCLPASIRKLSKLQHLDLDCCEKLESLPNLPCSLTHLSFDGYLMETLPDISNLTNLKDLTYDDDFKRRNRALNLRKLNQLDILTIRHRGFPKTELDEASEDINSFPELPLGLKELTVLRCQNLWTSPNLSNMKNLSRLTLEDCDNFPELGDAESLTSLHIEGCRKLSKLSGVGAMVKLKNLEISNCSNLVEMSRV